MNDDIKAGADINAGDGGYSESTKEKYDEFAKGRNQMKVFVLLRDDESESISEIGGIFMNQKDAQLRMFERIRDEFSIAEDIKDSDLLDEIRYSGINYCIETHWVHQ